MSKNKLTTCKTCGKEIARGVKKCVHCGKKQGNFFLRHKILSVLMVMVLIGGIAAATGGKNETSDDESSTATNSSQENEKKPDKKEDSKVTYENFLSINMGMTYEEVIGLFGEGKEVSSSSIGDIKSTVYTWNGKGISNVTLTIQNDIVTSKGQVGLYDKNADMTMEKYDAIIEGMTYEEAKEILGEGEITSQTKILDIESVTYSYVNKNGSNANFTFNGNKLALKAQFGLK
ncbi:DUF3862 domain-containing protein [Clostridium sp.]|uniref:DUF3862 domain-containing protein n=1 Tax=Clostridium sp. TaxID=1506 RepID=UPI001ED03189|nr:DUF3862 domain-containing protein [Clostridium sp.]MBS5886193.1 DUF3862 domain-containing protein [Clostridium sp.]MDU7242970.1 DUF3862 domain-containing protein [Clostridium sp.]